MECKIYTLSCPLENRVMYVGQTTNLKNRYYSHKNGGCNSDLNLWVYNLKIIGMFPIITVIDVYSIENKISVEDKWIKYYSLNGNELFNKINGRKPKYKCATITKAYRMPVDQFESIDKKIKDIIKKYQVKPLITNKSNLKREL